jgi:hypothetical protein
MVCTLAKDDPWGFLSTRHWKKLELIWAVREVSTHQRRDVCNLLYPIYSIIIAHIQGLFASTYCSEQGDTGPKLIVLVPGTYGGMYGYPRIQLCLLFANVSHWRTNGYPRIQLCLLFTNDVVLTVTRCSLRHWMGNTQGPFLFFVNILGRWKLMFMVVRTRCLRHCAQSPELYAWISWGYLPLHKMSITPTWFVHTTVRKSIAQSNDSGNSRQDKDHQPIERFAWLHSTVATVALIERLYIDTWSDTPPNWV